MSKIRITTISSLLLLLCGSLLVLSAIAANEAASTVGDAENVVVLGYKAALEAEEAGADVSALLAQLNVAAEYLSLAKSSLRRGDFESATGNASLCIEAAEGIAGDAEALRDSALRERFEYYPRVISASMIGIIVAISVSFLSWMAFKERYLRRLSKMKPEAIEDES